MTRSDRKAAIAGAFALALILPASNARAEAANLDWLAVAYVWGPEIGTDATDPSIDVEFSDVIDKLEMAFLGHVEAQDDTFGGFVDVVFMGLGDNVSRPAADLNADFDVSLLDLAAVWSPAAERYSGIEAFSGLRYIAVKFDLVVDPVPAALPTLETGIDDGYTDFLLGGRYVAPINDSWRLFFSADVSGGDTEGTWSVGGYGVYRNGAHRFYAGYRHFDLEIEDRGGKQVSTTFSGPILGYGFAF